ncbi:MAG: phosphatidate cytidylyltransferase [Microbacterium sp.]|uniref:phosphatidate cytidylyltransferase n=1 Tax=Microbacterium sp. TaxID=51671 RepID=UPI003A88E948
MSETAGGESPAPSPMTRREAARARREAAVTGVDAPVAPTPAHVPPSAPLPHEAMRAARTEFESQVAQAREHFEQANERIKQRTGRDLIVAILIGIAIGAVVLSSLIFLKWIFVLFALAASILGTVELARALQVGGRRVDLVPQLMLGSALIVAAATLGDALMWVTLFSSVAIIVVWRLIAQMIAKDGRTYGDVLRDVVVGVFLQLYVPFLASLCVVLLRQEQGEYWVLAFIIVAVATDTGAYAAGISFGKHPMAPRISPKKTWEGFAGAVLAAILAGLLLALFMLHLPLWCGVVLGVAVLAAATIGDLGESMLKRDLGIKDMSSWLPGHGGVLDRLDSILLSTVPALALYYFFSPLMTS